LTLYAVGVRAWGRMPEWLGASWNESGSSFGPAHMALTIHALEELEHDGLTGEDLEQILLSGRIVERQRDAETGHRRYLVLGRCLSEEPAYAVVKFANPRRVLVLTVFLA
jgi:hypothetical protein